MAGRGERPLGAGRQHRRGHQGLLELSQAPACPVVQGEPEQGSSVLTAGLGAQGCGVGEVAPRGRRAWMTTPPPAGRAEAPGRALQGTPGGRTSLTVLRHWRHPEGGLAGAGFGVTTRGVNFSPLLGQEHWELRVESPVLYRVQPRQARTPGKETGHGIPEGDGVPS